MKFLPKCCLFIFLLITTTTQAQDSRQVIDNMIKEANENSQLELLAHELLDVVGPRLVGTPQMKQAHEWVIDKYQNWGISAKKEQWGQWRAWNRGITHIDMVSPRVQTLDGTQLAWSPGTGRKGITAEVITIPKVENRVVFDKWLPKVRGKFVMTSMMQPTGRPDENWEEFATESSFEKMKNERNQLTAEWNNNIYRTGYDRRTIIDALEKAGAAGIVTSYWSNGFGVNRIFSARTRTIPTIELELEDYGMVYRLVEYGNRPKIKLVAESENLGVAPTFNTIGEIKGVEKPNEYVLLSAHLDSWDGAQGATDNGTGTLLMMEVMRILKKIYPDPKRTILVGHWGSEEQGTNGSRAFVEDHPEIVANIQAVFNQDNGTGRVTEISGSGFLYSYDYLTRWLYAVPTEISEIIKSKFPGLPVENTGGSSDHASFLAVGVPAFRLSSLDWSYRKYTWHTNRDTYDKIVFDDLRNNVILTAILAYMASEDPNTTSRERRVMPIDKTTGEEMKWPSQRFSNRNGGID